MTDVEIIIRPLEEQIYAEIYRQYRKSAWDEAKDAIEGMDYFAVVEAALKAIGLPLETLAALKAGTMIAVTVDEVGGLGK